MLTLPTWERAVAGLHLILQYPTEVPGVTLQAVLAEAYSARGLDGSGLEQTLRDEAAAINFDERFLQRPLNVDLSGGEKKRNETLQLALLKPRIAILDELDSGLDIDALRDCSRRVEALTKPTRLHTRARCAGDHPLHPAAHRAEAGHGAHPRRRPFVASGGPELADQLESDGYGAFVPELDEPDDDAAGALDDLFAPPS